MKKNQIKLLEKFIPILSLIMLAPLVASAQGTPSSSLADVISKISDLFGAVIPVLVALGVIYFIWGVVQYVIYDEEEAKKKGRDRMIYGIIGLAVIVSIWGLVAILNQTLGLGGANGLSGANAPNLTNLTPAGGSTSSCLTLSTTSKLPDYLNYVTCIIGQSVIPLIFAVAVVMFIWGSVSFFIINADEEAKRTQGKQFMIWGIIALAVMVSVWGLVNIIGGTFGIKTDFLPKVCPPGQAC